MNNCGKVALSGMMTSIGVVLMFLSSVVPYTTYAMPMFASMILLIVIAELGNKWAWMVYTAVSILSLFLTADKEAVILFVFLFGYYPILKVSIDRIKFFIFRIIFKLLIFSVAMVGSYYLMINLLSIPEKTFNVFGVSLPFILLIVGNLILLMYDYLLSGFTIRYNKDLKRLMSKILHL